MADGRAVDARRVLVARGWTDADRVAVPLGALQGFHTAHLMGEGPQSPIPKPMLGAILSCTDAAEECAALGHTCPDDECPHHIEVVIPREGNDAELYAELRARVREED